MLYEVITDSDGDGVQDAADLCPNEPETWNRYLDQDGCPDEIVGLDSDYDGVLDSVDQCPLERERNNFV